ncbi:MAG: hypothetical protein Q9227_008172 [Pyrenula ochraceoflavens]
MSKKRLVVAGGTGFLGSRICKSAVARGWDVTAISRSGAPNWSAITSSSTPPPWASSVNWAKADILSPQSYVPLLGSADAVVHSMGILLEADYKGVLVGTESPLSGLRKAFSTTKKPGDSRNPHLTYEVMNRDSAINLAQESEKENVRTFLYISAAAGAPMLPKRYITTKREAESRIASEFPKMRNIFVRPSFLYDSSRMFTLPIAAAGSVGSAVNSLAGGYLTNVFGAAVEKPMKADDVAEAVVEAIYQEDVKGVQLPKQIEDLATKAWRRSMI